MVNMSNGNINLASISIIKETSEVEVDSVIPGYDYYLIYTIIIIFIPSLAYKKVLDKKRGYIKQVNNE